MAVGRGVGLGVVVDRGVGVGVAVGKGVGASDGVGDGGAVDGLGQRVHVGVRAGVGSTALAEGASDVDVAGALQQPATTSATARMSPVMGRCAGGRRSITCSPIESIPRQHSLRAGR